MLNREDRQEIVEAVVMGIVTQGGPSIGDDGTCAYRGGDERKCAVGLFIDDADYEEWLEGHTVDDYNVQQLLEKSLSSSLDDDDIDFFNELQNSHDVAYSTAECAEDFWGLWCEGMKQLCYLENLRFPEELV